MITCPYCRGSFESRYAFCPHCGKKQPAYPKTAPSSGEMLKERLSSAAQRRYEQKAADSPAPEGPPPEDPKNPFRYSSRDRWGAVLGGLAVVLAILALFAAVRF